MNRLRQIWNLLALLGIMAFSPDALAGRSYSSGGGHSYSSHSSSSHSSSFGGGSHSFSSGGGRSSSSYSHSSSSGSKSFTSGSGKSYGASSRSSNDGRHSYTANKSYSSGPSHTFAPNDGKGSPTPPSQPARNSRPGNPSPDFNFDTAAARARKEQASKEQFTQFKERQAAGSPSSSARPPPVRTSDNYSYHRTVYVPDTVVIRTRPTRIYSVFSPYWYRPVVYYNDPYNSFFWWWLLDRTIDEQAWWAYHHRYDMDPARYDALLAHDQQLEARVAQLETQQVPRDPNYVPQGLDRDLMYSDQYVNQAYHNRPTTSGTVAFWLFGVPTAVVVCAFFIWLIWFKRWQTATT